MTDHRPAPLGPGPDDPFERELRTVLRSRVAGPLPPSLQQTLEDVARGGVAPAISSGGWRRPFASVLVAAAGLLLLAAGFNPVSTWMQAVTGPGATASVPAIAIGSASPSSSPMASRDPHTAIFDWSSPMVTLTADDIEFEAGRRSIPVPPSLAGYNDPGDQRYRTLELYWQAHAREQRLYLYFAADATHWWVSEARIYDDRSRPDWITFSGPLFRTPIGQAFHGDISLSSANGAVPGRVRMTNATLDPIGLGTGPRTFEGCRKLKALPQDVQDRLQATADLAQLDALAAAQDLCRVYVWVYQVPGGGVFTETWCTAPPAGTIRALIPGDRGETRVFVDDATTREPRPQPREGWGCAGPDASPSAVSSTSPTPSAPAIEVGFDWGDGAATLRAESLILISGDDKTERQEVSKVPATLAPIRRHVAPGVVELRWEWISEDVNRLVIQVTTDGARWHVSELGYQDRMLSDTLRRWTDVPIEGAVGEAWSGDLALDPSDVLGGAAAEVRLTGITFDPGITATDLEVPPSPSPVPDRPFVIDNGSVRLSADALQLSLRGDALDGPKDAAESDPGKTNPHRDSLKARWMDGDLLVQLQLEFRSDADRWWVSDGWISGWGLGFAPLDMPQVTAALGSTWTGDLDLQLPQIQGGGDKATGEVLHLMVRNLSVEPFRSTAP